MSTLQLIAKKAGVSAQTVSNVLSGRGVSKRRDAIERAKRILQIADELGYRPDAAARAIRSGRTLQIGVVIRNDRYHPLCHQLAFESILGLNEGLLEQGYVLSIIRVMDLESERMAQSRAMRENLLDGVVALSYLPDWVEKRLSDHFEHVIWADSNIWLPENCIRRDEKEAGMLAAKAAVNLGYKKMVWTGERLDSGHYSDIQRWAGVKEVAQQHGCTVTHCNGAEAVGDQAFALLDSLNRQTVVLAYDVYHARRIVAAGQTLGMSPGYDYGLICCDDSQTTQSHWPSLSRVSFDRYELGYQAAQMLLQSLPGSGVQRAGRPAPSRMISGQWFLGGCTAWGPDYQPVR
ncbi:MAG: hypothetical protein CMJ19_10165 [Phycisphaeraceae bacterium]|nr:hypothetical protein [Phycisphaeraceae bacterium]